MLHRDRPLLLRGASAVWVSLHAFVSLPFPQACRVCGIVTRRCSCIGSGRAAYSRHADVEVRLRQDEERVPYTRGRKEGRLTHGPPRFERQVTRSSSQASVSTQLRMHSFFFFEKSMEPDHGRVRFRQLASMP